MPRRCSHEPATRSSFPGDRSAVASPPTMQGHRSAARRVARHSSRAFSPRPSGGLPSGSCATMLATTCPSWWVPAVRRLGALRVSRRTVTEPRRSERRSLVAYHDSCHMLRELGIADAAAPLAGTLRAQMVRDLPRPDLCCGFGGTFSSASLRSRLRWRTRSWRALPASSHLVTADPGCLMQLSGAGGADRWPACDAPGHRARPGGRR